MSALASERRRRTASPPERGAAVSGEHLPAQARGRGTREALIVKAEELFADHGFDAVSLREIAVAAGTRNTGAAQYYFGDKESLVRAVFDFRAPVLNARRGELLADVPSADDPLRATLGALLRPLAEQIRVTRYVGFLGRLQADQVRAGQISAEAQASFRAARKELAGLLPRLPGAVFRRRFRLLTRMSVAALADHERSLRDGRARSVGRLEDLLTDLLDAGVGMLKAPTSR